MNTVGQNKQIRYECDKDYKLVGPNGSTCINGNWKPSVKLVKCVKDQAMRPIVGDEEQLEKLSMLAADGKDETALNNKKITLLKEKINDYENTFFLDDASSQQKTPNSNLINPFVKETPKSAKKLAKAKKNLNKLRRLKKHKVKTTTTRKYDNSIDDDDSQDELEFSINDKVSNTHNKKRRYKHRSYVNYE